MDIKRNIALVALIYNKENFFGKRTKKIKIYSNLGQMRCHHCLEWAQEVLMMSLAMTSGTYLLGSPLTLIKMANNGDGSC